MKHFRADYNERIQDNANLIPEDEPVFLLRGQDIFTPGLMLDWAKQLRLAGGDPEVAQLIENGASEVIQWQKEHPERMIKNNRLRLPDMPNVKKEGMFRKLPVSIEAFKYGVDKRPDWFDDKVTANEIITHVGTDLREPENYYCEIKTLEGTMRGNVGDYIIKGVNGEIYPCKPDIFAKTYESI